MLTILDEHEGTEAPEHLVRRYVAQNHVGIDGFDVPQTNAAQSLRGGKWHNSFVKQGAEQHARVSDPRMMEG